MKRYLVALLVLCASSVTAETWEWVDGQGTVSFTDDRQNIPKQYRKSARKLSVESTPAPPQPSPPVAPETQAPPAPITPASTAAPSVPTPAAAPGAKLQDTYGGKKGAEWKEAFASLNNEIKGVDGELKEKQRLLKEPGNLSRSDYMKLENELRRLSAILTALLSRWELLNKEATAASVPADLRQ